MKPITELAHQSGYRTSEGAKWMRRLLQLDACAGLSRWLRSLGEYVEPYDRHLHDEDDR